jgi:hypothetical protein
MMAVCKDLPIFAGNYHCLAAQIGKTVSELNERKL